MASKKQYEAPALSVVGTFETITQAAKNGFALDAPYPVGTPQPLLTFS